MTNNRRDAGVDFPKDIANHQMMIKLDNALYRHLSFRKPDNSHQWFELVTFPHVLVINGDMGTWTFSRVEDMFTFFRGERINTSYWSEKVLSSSRFGGPEEKFDRDVWIGNVLQHVEDYADDFEQRESIKAALTREVFDCEEDEGCLKRALAEFEHDGFEFTDSWEIDGKAWTYHFIWCLYAIVWGIQQYDAATAQKEAA